MEQRLAHDRHGLDFPEQCLAANGLVGSAGPDLIRGLRYPPCLNSLDATNALLYRQATATKRFNRICTSIGIMVDGMSRTPRFRTRNS